MEITGPEGAASAVSACWVRVRQTGTHTRVHTLTHHHSESSTAKYSIESCVAYRALDAACAKCGCLSEQDEASAVTPTVRDSVGQRR